MGGYSVGETSIPGRLAEVERDLHTVRFRLEQIDQHRLPDRMTGVESAMRNMEDSINDLKTTSHQTMSVLRETRAELSDDMNSMEDMMNTRITNLQSSVDKLTGKLIGAVAASTIIVGAVAWIIEHFQLLVRFTGG